MALTVYQYPNCSTCKKALKWLGDRPYKSIDITKAPPTAAQLAKAFAGVPIKQLFNVSGESYRNGGWKDKLPTLTDAQAYAALAKDGKLIKRPLVIGDGVALVGFKEDEWSEKL